MLLDPVRDWAPNGCSCATVPGAALGFAAFRVADRESSQGVQPHVDSARQVAIVFDGRLDNSGELKAALSIGGSTGGPEVLSLAYERWGEDLVCHLRGDFAFVIWDWRRRQVLAGRDPFGVRPLNYVRRDGGLDLASDVEQLLAGEDGRRSIDAEMMLDYLTWDYRHPERTFFSDVKRVPPGHLLVDKGTGPEVRRWWLPDSAVQNFRGADEVHEEFRTLFLQSVRRRTDVDGSVLVHLSGGADSTSIVCAADRLGRAGQVAARFVAASGAYPGLEADESRYFCETASRISFPHRTWNGLAQTSLDLDHPSFAMPSVRTPLADGTRGDVEIAHEIGARVLLSGQGGDELGSSWGVLRTLLAEGHLSELLRGTLGAKVPLRTRFHRVALVASWLLPDQVRGFVKHARSPAVELPAWLGPVLRDRAARRTSGEHPPPAEEVFASHSQRDRWRQFAHPRHAMIVDSSQRYGAAELVEFRYPFLDADLVSFVFRVPAKYWNVSVSQARLHRDALRRWMPPAIAFRTDKTHFRSVQTRKIRLLAPQIREIFCGDTWALDGFVHQHVIREMFERVLEHDTGSHLADWSVIWSCANAEAWLRSVLGYCVRSRRAS
jgi:asparagine synthase (glutamine-hydrolysing)